MFALTRAVRRYGRGIASCTVCETYVSIKSVSLEESRFDEGAYIFQTAALVIFQQAVSPAELALAEGAVTNDGLRPLPALLGAAASLLASHDAQLRCLCK